jgi:hypothetical protein
MVMIHVAEVLDVELTTEQGLRDVDREHSIDVLLGDLPQRLDRSDRRVVDQDVHVSEGRDHHREQLRELAVLADVSIDRDLRRPGGVIAPATATAEPAECRRWRATAGRSAPRRAAIALPIPVAAPITIATRPSTRRPQTPDSPAPTREESRGSVELLIRTSSRA